MMQVHLEYLEAGADILVTSSYQVCCTCNEFDQILML
jgi:S-methylmethionine-dependent homocysteine/selenocysteine methylase